MTGFAHRLLGHDDPAGTIRPIVTSLYEPAPPAPAELDVFRDATEHGTTPEPAAPSAARAPAAPADAGSWPASAAGPRIRSAPAAGPHVRTDQMAESAHRLDGHDDPAGTIRPIVTSLYEPAPPAPAELDMFRDATEHGTTPEPTAPPARRARQGWMPGEDAHQGQPHRGQAGPEQAQREQARHPLIPAGALPEAAAVLRRRVSSRGQPAGLPPARLPSRRPPSTAQLPETAEVAIQASAPVLAAGAVLPPYPALPAVLAPRPGTVPTLADGRPGWPASRRGDNPRPEPGPPDVHITIGRIDVRAVPEPTRTTRQEPRRPGAPTLQDYLRGRDGRA